MLSQKPAIDCGFLFFPSKCHQPVFFFGTQPALLLHCAPCTVGMTLAPGPNDKGAVVAALTPGKAVQVEHIRLTLG